MVPSQSKMKPVIFRQSEFSLGFHLSARGTMSREAQKYFVHSSRSTWSERSTSITSNIATMYSRASFLLSSTGTRISWLIKGYLVTASISCDLQISPDWVTSQRSNAASTESCQACDPSSRTWLPWLLLRIFSVSTPPLSLSRTPFERMSCAKTRRLLNSSVSVSSSLRYIRKLSYVTVTSSTFKSKRINIAWAASSALNF
mmetsp:Transcript_52022/g.71000  ORF Transcript_52022/g.71000 Transcript_52022/m.71000 type:complete len:201 (-) Transcript_52022:491-1093(-)